MTRASLLQLDLFGNLQGIVHVDTEVTHRALHLGMTQVAQMSINMLFPDKHQKRLILDGYDRLIGNDPIVN